MATNKKDQDREEKSPAEKASDAAVEARRVAEREARKEYPKIDDPHAVPSQTDAVRDPGIDEWGNIVENPPMPEAKEAPAASGPTKQEVQQEQDEAAEGTQEYFGDPVDPAAPKRATSTDK